MTVRSRDAPRPIDTLAEEFFSAGGTVELVKAAGVFPEDISDVIAKTVAEFTRLEYLPGPAIAVATAKERSTGIHRALIDLGLYKEAAFLVARDAAGRPVAAASVFRRQRANEPLLLNHAGSTGSLRGAMAALTAVAAGMGEAGLVLDSEPAAFAYWKRLGFVEEKGTVPRDRPVRMSMAPDRAAAIARKTDGRLERGDALGL